MTSDDTRRDLTRDLLCPFCRKHTGQVDFSDGGTFIFAQVRCTNCDVRGPRQSGNTFYGGGSYGSVVSSAILDWLKMKID